jgi:glycosyltransferase involved in cell wall biosynthesis
MIFLNEAQFIEEAIASVFAQTYEHWELLLVDDGSTDASVELTLDFAAHYPGRVCYLEHAGHQNRGMSATRNLGIRHANGDYVAFLDADDVWLPDKLQEQVAMLGAYPEAAMICGETLYWHSWTGNPEDMGRDYIPQNGFATDTLVTPPGLLGRYLRGEAAVPCTCSILVRRKFFDQFGGFVESFRSLYEDQAFYARVCLHEPVLVATRCWDRYRQHPASACSTAETTGRARAAARAARINFLEWLETYIREQGIEDAKLWRALRDAQRQTRHPALARLFRSKKRLLGIINEKAIHRETRFLKTI